jgi:hypothetical protein
MKTRQQLSLVLVLPDRPPGDGIDITCPLLLNLQLGDRVQLGSASGLCQLTQLASGERAIVIQWDAGPLQYLNRTLAADLKHHGGGDRDDTQANQ